jgi:hypothetical protein
MMTGLRLNGRGALTLLCALLLSLLACAAASAQTGTSTVRGTVTDPQGNVVPGASVTLSNAEKNFTRSQVTTDTGSYVFTAVPPGTYQIEAEAKGFKKATVSDVRALVDQPTDIPVRLEVGSVNESITVSASDAEALVNTQDATIGNTFVSKQITQLPLESRNVVQLLSLQPGVTPSGYVAGSRADQANITLDGVDVNEQQTGLDPNTLDAFSSVLRVTPDSIQEFRVTTTNPNASQGRSAGAQVTLVTKSGTNSFHGSLYEFHRNTVTTANDFFNNAAGLPRPKLLRNVYGGSIGGPIKKNRLFFFYTYEGRRDASQQSVLETVPLANLGQGQVRFEDANLGLVTLDAAQLNALFPAVGLNPVALNILADAARRYPANDFTVGDTLNTAGFRFNAPISVKYNTHIARFDYNLSSKHNIYVRGNYQSDLTGNAPAFPDQPAPNRWNHPYGFAVGHTWTISSTKVNRFVYGLTRLAYTNQGNSTDNTLFFRSVYRDWTFGADQVNSFQRTFSRVTPTHNFTDDYSWNKGNHSFQFGGNVRLVRNQRVDFGNAFDIGYTNYFFYKQSGNVLINPLVNAGYQIAGSTTNVKAALAAVIGRLPFYRANFNFNHSGQLLPAGAPIERTFATQEGEGYFQDSWKLRPNLTLTYGLRYSLSRPVYETHGFQAKPDISLADVLRQREQAAGLGQPYYTLITVDLAGPANNKPGYYPLDKNNFQPRIAVAWEPHVRQRFLHRVFGNDGDSVIRGGFAVINDFFGQQLAVNFEGNNRLGFSSAQQISANTFNVTSNPPPLITGTDMQFRNLPRILAPGQLTFPQQQPADMRRRIEGSLNDNLVSPTEYSWNLTYERKMPGGLVVSASYIGRLGRHLLATLDVAEPVDLFDPKSLTDWYTAAGQLEFLRSHGVDISAVPNIAYFNNLFPNLPNQLADYLGNDAYRGFTPTQAVYGLTTTGDCTAGNDWTTAQDCIDGATGVPNFYQLQYGALSAFSTVGFSNYHAGTLTIRERFKNTLTMDFNYTLSKSMDNASGLQTSGVYGSAFILNPFRQRDNYAPSDFDIRHIVNANAVWQIPVGRGRWINTENRFVNGLLGGWQLSGIMRWNSGLPAGAPFDAGAWATNWEIESNSVRIRPVQANPGNDPSGHPNIFSDPVAAYQSFRSARPGETGDRNIIRYPGYFDLDAGLAKSFTMPWSENHKLQIRWETFNVTNTQHLTGISDFSTDVDPFSGSPSPEFGRFTSIQGTPRVMQFGLRYSF